MKIALHQTWQEVEKLSGSWNSLLAASASDTPFLTWEWVNNWWRNYSTGRLPFVVSIRDRDELIGIAPFYVDSLSVWGTSWTCLKLIGDGSGDSDYLDCFARRGREVEFIMALVDFLADRVGHWECLRFPGTLEGSPCLAALMECAEQRSWRVATELIPCATVRLPRRWSDYLHMLKPRMRTKVRSSLASLDEQIHSIPQPCHTAEEIEQWLPILFDLHTKRWQTKNRPGVFRDPAKRSFYRDLSHSLLGRGCLAFHRLNFGERPLALQYGLLHRNRFHLLQEGYDPSFESLRPGLMLRAWLMRHWIETGLQEYDFLAGVAQHKMDWGAQQKLSLRLCLAPTRRSAWALLDLPRAQEAFKKQVRRATPEALLSWRQRIIAWRDRGRWNLAPAGSTSTAARDVVCGTVGVPAWRGGLVNVAPKPAVVVLNLAYTGVGIIRNLQAQRVPLVGVTADRKACGTHTRLAEVIFGPDSARAPEELARFLGRLAQRFRTKPILFATRDQDVLFVERFRDVLKGNFLLPMPEPGVVERILNKWEMAQVALSLGIPVPETHRISSVEQLEKIVSQLLYPCVVKPISSFHWRGEEKWKQVGQRKAFPVSSRAELLGEYRTLAKANPEILIQELIPGGDDHLFVFGGYFDRNSKLRAGFEAHKILQSPPGFGTGCIVEIARAPILRHYSTLLLQEVKYHGIAEVEFKLDVRDGRFKFIEVNPRHWDWHQLGTACGVNLSDIAYRDLSGQEAREQAHKNGFVKWIAEDAFCYEGLRLLLHKQIHWRDLVSCLRGKKIYALFSMKDPLPFAYVVFGYLLPNAVRKLFSPALSWGRKLWSRPRRTTA